MRTFQINENLSVECRVYNRMGYWGHSGNVLRNGVRVAHASIQYQNRTWERYQFESLLHHLAESKNLTVAEKEAIKEYAKR